jgi:hypothetical protein
MRKTMTSLEEAHARLAALDLVLKMIVPPFLAGMSLEFSEGLKRTIRTHAARGFVDVPAMDPENLARTQERARFAASEVNKFVDAVSAQESEYRAAADAPPAQH